MGSRRDCDTWFAEHRRLWNHRHLENKGGQIFFSTQGSAIFGLNQIIYDQTREL